MEGREPKVSLVSAKEAAKVLLKPNTHHDIVLVDVHVQKSDILPGTECIPGAVAVGMDEMEVAFPDDGGNHQGPKKRKRLELRYKDGNILPGEDLRKKVEAIGISNTTTVLAYTSAPTCRPLSATRFLWVLAYCGVDDLRLIDGGIQMWKHHDFKTSMEWTDRRPQMFFSHKMTESVFPINAAYLSSTEDVEQMVRQQKASASDHVTELIGYD